MKATLGQKLRLLFKLLDDMEVAAAASRPVRVVCKNTSDFSDLNSKGESIPRKENR